MNTFLRSEEFDTWLTGLKDNVGRARIIHRIRSAEHGNFGDCEPVGEGVSEMRIHVGPGYRTYFTRRAEVVYLLLLGGDKSSQKRDIKRAIEMARTLDKESP
ncbi:MAG: type II toxin-antitoxin system RelE/ParE family toxin [Betaproteobacteria bacterium]|nr:type II toxin-antitoxin system RelE/ParE family toxin [Betaproteobacteria bacterium]